MDQDTSNSPGKARWRERLGMGNSGKDMPKISDEFRPASAPAKPAAPRDTRLPPATIQGQQPVTRPAPMAPRTPAPMAPRVPPQAQSRQQPVQQQPVQQQPARPVAPLPQGASGLGDRLRAERQAAERAAEQRVAQARGKNPERPSTPPPAQPAPPQSQRPPQPAPPPQSQRPAQPERPKFSFSPEELAKDKREAPPPAPAPAQAPPEREYPTFSGKAGTGAAPPPLTPPRPALGGNAAAQQRPQPPKPPAGAPPAGPSFQPRYNGPPQPPAPAPGGNYRSLDPPPSPSGFTPKSRPYADTAAFREDPLTRRDAPRPPVNREYDSYRRGPALPPAPQQQAYGDELDGPSLPDYRRRPPVPARGRQPAPAYDEDVNEVFEDEEPPRPQRRRASAQDYNRAYRDYEEGYEAEPRRRRGPWPLLLAILLGGIILTAGIIYYYLTYMKPQGQANGGNVPVIEAPDLAPKTAPENSLGSSPGTQGSAQPTDAQRKQIYDRILGDDEVNSGQNQVVPTQEQPQAVEPTGGTEGQGAAPLPLPSSGTEDNTGEPLPLPLPPPGATDQQGSLLTNSNQQTAALGAVNKATASPVPEPASTSTADSGAPVPGQLAKATEEIASAPPPAAEQVVSEPEVLPPEPQPAKPKVKAEKKPVKKTAAVEDAVNTGQDGAVEPLVLVPPAQPPVADANQAPIVPPESAPQATESAASDQKSKSFFNFGSGPTGKRKLTGKAAESAQARGSASGNWANSPDPNAVQADSSGAEPQQIASIAPAPEPQPIPAPQPEQPAQKAKPSSGGFTAQLASFRSEAEAQAEFDRLRAKHGGVLGGFNPRIVKATVAGAPRYRLSVGPMASRSQASKVCDSLIAAGERDCLVRGN